MPEREPELELALAQEQDLATERVQAREQALAQVPERD